MITGLYEDDEIVVVDKPSGLSSQPGEGVRISLIEAFERDFGRKAYPVHRLDRETSGCVVFAKSASGARKWTELVASRDVVRTYQAVCGGLPRRKEGVIDDPVGVRGERKSATTRYRLVSELQETGRSDGDSNPDTGVYRQQNGSGWQECENPRTYSLLELVLGSGRNHQIRIHLASIGLPILGDDRHGDFALNKSMKKSYGVRRLMLWARSLRLPSGLEIKSAMPEHFSAFFARFSDVACPIDPERLTDSEGLTDSERPAEGGSDGY